MNIRKLFKKNRIIFGKKYKAIIKSFSENYISSLSSYLNLQLDLYKNIEVFEEKNLNQCRIVKYYHGEELKEIEMFLDNKSLNMIRLLAYDKNGKIIFFLEENTLNRIQNIWKSMQMDFGEKMFSAIRSKEYLQCILDKEILEMHEDLNNMKGYKKWGH